MLVALYIRIWRFVVGSGNPGQHRSTNLANYATAIAGSDSIAISFYHRASGPGRTIFAEAGSSSRESIHPAPHDEVEASRKIYRSTRTGYYSDTAPMGGAFYYRTIDLTGR